MPFPQRVAMLDVWRSGLVVQLALSLGFSTACDSTCGLADMRISMLQHSVDVEHPAPEQELDVAIRAALISLFSENEVSTITGDGSASLDVIAATPSENIAAEIPGSSTNSSNSDAFASTQSVNAMEESVDNDEA
eukprot:TRINITY_DN11099_c0_g1_i3.p1 TRINITY_DN11099_c0_g1~~TRINITY_DN11099_c0_g1_i3.p1  ORF type:complete len:135 (-),score=27.38 TRINITY_DN11099_c0_g1_i3:2-406(-)